MSSSIPPEIKTPPTTVSGTKPLCLIVGLSGVTNGGKTTLSNKLAAHYPPGVVEILLLDDYFWTDTNKLDYLQEVKHWDFDKMGALNFDGFYRDVLAKIDKLTTSPNSSPPHILILDGFLLFNEPRLLAVCHLRYDFSLPYEVAKHRRETRFYDPPDVPGYFEAVAWPAYLKHSRDIEALKRQEGIVTIDGTEEGEKIFCRVLNDVECALSGR
uniref:Nicotinamide riboside kinase 1 n=1 Tax=Cacopsylla melanoneura TaxID=428564 RepID=A0A8D8Y8H0_9HEMI